MSVDWRLGVCALASIGGHVALTRGLEYLPPRPPVPENRIVTVRVVEPPAPAPEPEPPKPPEPLKPPEPVKPIVHERPRPHDAPVARHDVAPVDTPPVDHPPATTDTTTAPVFGVTMESTSQGGTGPAMAVGNTTRVAPTAPATAAVKPLAEPVAAAEVTKLPLPLHECPAKYTEEARTAAVEGVVVLAAVIDEHGRARDIQVVQGLSQGLTQSAIAELTRCPFSPGERNGQTVPVRLREIKFRFVLAEAQ
jgi:periplasmic protein TonB